MATLRPPFRRVSPVAPPPSKVNRTSYTWVDTEASTSAASGSVRMNPSNATQGGIVPGTAHGVGLSLKPPQQPMNSGRGQAASLPVVTADSLPPAWNTQKTTQAQLPGIYEVAEIPAGMQYPEAPKKFGKRKKGKKGVEDDGGAPPELAGALLGSGAFSFGGGISSTGSVIPPPSPRLDGGSGPKPNSTKADTATRTALGLPPIEIVPDSPERGLVSRMEGWETGGTLSQPLPGGNPWTEKIVPSPLPRAVPGGSKGAGGFGSGGWGEPATSTSGIVGGISRLGGVVPVPASPAANKKKKKREGGGGWGGS